MDWLLEMINFFELISIFDQCLLIFQDFEAYRMRILGNVASKNGRTTEKKHVLCNFWVHFIKVPWLNYKCWENFKKCSLMIFGWFWRFSGAGTLKIGSGSKNWSRGIIQTHKKSLKRRNSLRFFGICASYIIKIVYNKNHSIGTQINSMQIKGHQ